MRSPTGDVAPPAGACSHGPTSIGISWYAGKRPRSSFEKTRRPSGNVDLLISNFDSAPDTAFVVQNLAPAVAAARRGAEAGDRGAGRIAQTLGDFILAAAPGMVAGGFHTPNHRWVLVSALSMARQLFPHLDVLGTVEAYLAESIDINADGEYIERSTGVYNAVVNRSLRLAAQALQRPELLQPVRRNLELSYHLMHGDATVLTSISSRQDRGERTVPVGLIDSYYALGRLDGNGFFLAVADWLADQGGELGSWPLQPFVDRPEWRQDGERREPLPQSYAKYYPVSGLWRVRRGQLSATAAAGLTTPFSLRYGQVELRGVKLSSTYFATGQFIGEDFAGGEAGVKMHHWGRNRIYSEKDYDRPIYWLPIDQKADGENWRRVRAQRQTYDLPPLEVDLEITEVENGFDLRLKTAGGCDKVPFQVELVFGPGGEFETSDALVQGQSGSTAFLKSGYGVYRVGRDGVSVGPGQCDHRMWQMRNSEIDSQGFRVLITLTAPVERVVELRVGQWSAVSMALA